MTLFFGKIRKKWQLIVYVSLILGAVTFFVSTLIPPKYRSDITVLVVQHNIDTLSAARSAEYLGDVFSQVLYTDSFLSDVLTSPFDIDNNFSSDPKKRKKQWEKEVNANKIGNTGILLVSVFDTSRIQAEKIAKGIGWNFVTNGNKYHGGAENIEAKIVDGPITTSGPAYPNVFMNALFGFLTGLFGSLVLIYFFEGFDLRVFDSRQTTSSIVGREIQRQLKKRSKKAELKYLDERNVYQIEKTIVQTERGKKQSFSDAKEKMVTKLADTETEKILSEEIALKEAMVQEAIGQKKQPQVKETSTMSMEDNMSEPNFITRLYQKSLFANKLFSKNKKEIVEKALEDQRKRDKAQEEVVEHVKKVDHVEDKADQLPWMSSDRTAPAPDNLPIFMRANEAVEGVQAEPERKTFQAETETEKEQIASVSEKIKASPGEIAQAVGEKVRREPSDDEVKDRLNKLLKGEL